MSSEHEAEIDYPTDYPEEITVNVGPTINFRPMTEVDFMAFMGAEEFENGDQPLIHYGTYLGEEAVIILDANGAWINFFTDQQEPTGDLRFEADWLLSAEASLAKFEWVIKTENLMTLASFGFQLYAY
jgi:hypothetical protein